MDNIKEKELNIINQTISMLQLAVGGEQLTSPKGKDDSGDEVKVDLNGLHTVVKILKTVREMEQEILRYADGESMGGVVILPQTENLQGMEQKP